MTTPMHIVHILTLHGFKAYWYVFAAGHVGLDVAHARLSSSACAFDFFCEIGRVLHSPGTSESRQNKTAHQTGAAGEIARRVRIRSGPRCRRSKSGALRISEIERAEPGCDPRNRASAPRQRAARAARVTPFSPST